MNGKNAIVLLSGLLLGCALVPLQAAAQMAAPPATPPATQISAVAPAAPAPTSEERWVAIRQVTCARLMELSDDDRRTASTFYLGYQASRAGAGGVNLNAIRGVEARAFGYCQAFPNRTAAQAFAAAYRTRLR
jgi:hypothetical protein